MAYSFGSGSGYDREIRLARLKKFRWLIEKIAIVAILGVMSQGESANSVLRLPFAGVMFVCLILIMVAEWYERKLMNWGVTPKRKGRQDLTLVGGFGAVGIVLVLVVLMSNGLLSRVAVNLALIGAAICFTIIADTYSRQKGYRSVLHELTHHLGELVLLLALAGVYLVATAADYFMSRLGRFMFAMLGIHILAMAVLNPLHLGVVLRTGLFLVSVQFFMVSYAIHARLRYLAKSESRP